jgi:hypothetical protein
MISEIIKLDPTEWNARIFQGVAQQIQALVEAKAYAKQWEAGCK